MPGDDHVRADGTVAQDLDIVDAHVHLINLEALEYPFIAAVDLTSPSLGEVLARYRDLPVVHAVRQSLYWAEDRLRRLGARPDYLTDPAWWRRFERAVEAGAYLGSAAVRRAAPSGAQADSVVPAGAHRLGGGRMAA